ncbi:hypothetical protein B0H17DRAFT_1119554 [Mycena rosella]|uniref:Uncharacterized protein n=1 Tax=Mycena rosella TaxID=1033263 RepID=A0AAD7B073_MYCRO|nr:hypothetical protein B0H17DRAFT_1119554 [Mycena rosella]
MDGMHPATPKLRTRLVSSTRTMPGILPGLLKTWSTPTGSTTPVPQQTAMKASRQGRKGGLNVYSVGSVNGSGAGLIGYSAFPLYSGAPQDDGIVILFSSVSDSIL